MSILHSIYGIFFPDFLTEVFGTSGCWKGHRVGSLSFELGKAGSNLASSVHLCLVEVEVHANKTGT